MEGFSRNTWTGRGGIFCEGALMGFVGAKPEHRENKTKTICARLSLRTPLPPKGLFQLLPDFLVNSSWGLLSEGGPRRSR